MSLFLFIILAEDRCFSVEVDQPKCRPTLCCRYHATGRISG